nr:Os08g0473800 [Ipomoea batatas]
MVDIRSAAEVAAGVVVAGAVGVFSVASADKAWAPVKAIIGRAAFEDTVDSSAVFIVGASMVDYDVGNGFYPLVVKRRHQSLACELVLASSHVVSFYVQSTEEFGRYGWQNDEYIRSASAAKISTGLVAEMPFLFLIDISFEIASFNPHSKKCYHGWDPGMGEDISVSLQNPIVVNGIISGSGERPKPLRPSIMVIDESHGVLRQNSDHPRRLSGSILQSPELGVIQRGLKNPLGREIKRRRSPAGVLDPPDQLIAMSVLIVPEFPDGEFRLRVVHVDLNGGESLDEIVALDEIESPAVESEIGFEPIHPFRDFSLHLRAAVVDVRRVPPRVSGVGISGAFERGIVAADLGWAPVEFIVGSSAFEDVDHSSAIGSLGGSVI